MCTFSPNNLQKNLFRSNIVKSLYVFFIIVFLLLYPGQNKAAGQEIPELKVTSDFSVSVALPRETIIKSIDIDITGYDTSVFEITEITLAGGILENMNYGLADNTTDGQIHIGIYALGNPITGKGDVVFINFDIKGEGNSTTLSFINFQSNELPADGGFSVNDAFFPSLRISINYSPVLDNSQTPEITPIDEDDFENNGTSIAEIIEDGSVTDADGFPTEAMAVTGIDNTNGVWQYSLDNGADWNDFNTETGIIDISANARLLDGTLTGSETHRIRFVPEPDWNSTAVLTFRAWDKNSGTAGQTADATVGGSGLAFSSVTDEAIIEVIAVNDAPVLDTDQSPYLTAIGEKDTENEGNTVSEIIAEDSVTDADGSPARAIAVTSVDNTNGTWQYSVDNGIVWTSFSDAENMLVDISDQARLLGETSRIRFVPGTGWYGTSTFKFCAWDKSIGAAGETGDARTGGGTSEFSFFTDNASIEVTPVNDAPLLDDTFFHVLAAIDENEIENNGNSVAEIISDGSVEDVDGSPAEAIAVIGVNNLNGIWQYSTDNGISWTDFSEQAGVKVYMTGEARLLDETNRIRFVPDTDWNGTSTFTFRAWDMSSGTAGQTANASVGGDTSAFSSVTDKAEIEVSPVNNAPVLDNTESPVLTPIDEDDIENNGNSIAEILAQGSVTDEDGLPEQAIAVTAVDNTDGTWQYSTDNGFTWTDFTAETETEVDISYQARLLDETHKIRFVPNPDWSGTAEFTFRAWDKSSGEPGKTADAGEGGDELPFSLLTDKADINVNPLNDAPVLDNTVSPELSPINVNNDDSEGNSIAQIVTDGSITDADADVPAEAIAVTAVDNTNGKWQFSVNNGAEWKDFTAETGSVIDISANARLLDGSLTHKIRFVPDKDWFGTAAFTFLAWDKTEGKAGETADTGTLDDDSAFSSDADDAGIEVIFTNNAPILDPSQSPELSATDLNDFDSDGNTVAEIVADGSITDEDGLPAEAIAVIAVDNTDGKWEYSLDDGVTWTDFTEQTGEQADISAEARLLDENHKIRFVPDEDWAGIAIFTFRAWDKSIGTAGEIADASTGGDILPFSLATDDASIEVTVSNHAPILDASQSPMLTAIEQDEFESSGNTVSEIVTDGSIFDEDGDAPEAIAVTAVNNTNGTWEYSTDNSSAWILFTGETGKRVDISTQARLLDESCMIRFVPDQEWEGTATFTFLAWDKSTGTAGSTADTSERGGISAFSSDSDDADIEVRSESENYAPVLDTGYFPELSDITRGETDSIGNSIAEIVADGSITDPDGPGLEAIAVTSVDNTRGVWQYSTDNGDSWRDFSPVTGANVAISAQARLLDGTLTGSETHKIRFKPVQDWTGAATFTFRAWDKSSGVAGQTADAGIGGDTSEFSSDTDEASIEVIIDNEAPILNNSYSPALTAINENDFDNNGNSVAEIVADGSITDSDGPAAEAIAVTGVDNTNGKWQYSVDNGAGWKDFSAATGINANISDRARLLDGSLTGAGTHRIRFVPVADWSGSATFKFRAWDKSSGIPGETSVPEEGGGASAFSSDSDNASIVTNPVNDAPTLDNTRNPGLSSITENNFNSQGNTVGEIVADGSVIDTDGPPSEAIAVISVDNTNGTWQYSANNSAWKIFSASKGRVNISDKALLLDENSRIRFVPNNGWNGSASFTFRAWDKSEGTPGGTANASTGGGTSAFSSDTDVAVILVTPAEVKNKAPVLDISQAPMLTGIDEDDFNNNGTSIADIIVNVSITDPDGPDLKSIAVIVVDNTNGMWQYSLNNGGTWSDFSTVRGTKVEILRDALLLDGTITGNITHKVRFVPNPNWNGTSIFSFRAWDKTTGAAGQRTDASAGGGESAFSSNADDAAIKANPVNDAPALDNRHSPALSSINENMFDSNGDSVADIIADRSVADADGSPAEAMAVILVDNSNGVWQYSPDSASWTDFTPSRGSEINISGTARLLDHINRIRFIPNADWSGSSSFTFRAWDKSAGVPGATADADTGGGISPFSSATDKVFITVSDVARAHAGQDRTVEEGEKVILDGSGSSGPIVTYKWTQTSGIPIEISDPTAVSPFFTAPEVDTGIHSLVFMLAVNNNIETQDTVTINVSDIPAPVASLAAEPLSGNTPLEVTFTDMSQGEISQWLWDFGDGYQSITQNPAHTYTSAGTYTVKLTVSGRGGQHTGIRENYITVNNIPLKADFKADPLEGPLPLTVSFTQNSQGEVKEWMWDFGDGKTSSVPDPVHTFEAVGAYTVSLTVKSEEQTVTKTETSYINVIGRIIDGRVTAEDTGQGLANCWVEVWSDNVFQSGASTDQGGYYTITGLPKAGNLILAAWPPEGTSDYYYQYYKGKDNPALADQATTIGGDLTDIDFILKRQPTLGILGTIHDGENPVPGIEVNVFSKSIAFGMNTMTDENGTYAITGLKPADDYKVSVWSEQYETEFYYAIPEQETVGEYIPDASAFSEDQATPVTPEDPSLPNIDIIVNVSQGESIEGYVFDEENTPLENIRVNAWSTESDTGNNALTDETGYYIIPGLEKVTADEAETKGYIVEIRSDDYPYQAYNRAEKPEHAVKIATNVTGVNFYLKTSVVISGVITDQDGNPVTGAEVSAWSLSGQDQKQGSAITDETGAYSITLPAADDYVVGVFSPDFPVQYYTVEPGRETPDTLDLTGGDINSADIVLDKGNVIKGVVYVKECNQGLCEDIPARAGIWVNIWSGSEAAGGDVQTDNQGRYEITGLDKNIIDYVISVRDPGYVPAFYSPNGTVYNWESAGRVAPSVSDDRNIVLLTGFSIKGRVTYNGKPVPGIRAEAQAEDMDGWGSTVTSSDDEFNYIITKLMPGTYNVTIQPENFMDMTQTVIIEDQGVLLDFDLAEEPQRSISGVITGLESGRQVKITAWSLSKDCTGSAQADGTGQPVAYIIAGLKPASDYIVELSSDDYPFQIFDGKSSIEDADYADLSDSNAPGINFALTSATASISGQVIFPGDAVPGETVRIDVFSLTTGLETGVEIKLADSLIVRYEITGLAPDTDNILYLSSDKYMNQYCSGSDYGSPDEEDAVHLNTSENPDADADFRLRRGSEITGRVIDKDDNPVEGINIEAWSAVTGSSGFAVTSENGTYTIEGLEGAYDYIVRAWDTKLGSFFYNSEKTVLDESLAAHVSTSEGNPSDINIRLIELESISGTVTDLEGYPLELMWVEAYSELMQAGGGVFTDEDGSYLINGLPTSRDYTVSARPDWYTVPQEKFNVSSGSSGVNFTLNPREGYRIKGKVTDNQGNAVTGARVEAWSESQDIRGKVWSVTDRSGEYELTGIPRADDYVIMAWPPEDSYYSFFSEEGFSVPLEDDTVNIEMSLSLVINGTVTAKDDGAPMGNVQVIAVSKTNRFQGQAVTDKYGFYELNEVPEGSNYDITAIGGENFSGETKTDQAPGGGIDFVLEKSSSITGTVRNKTTGEPVSDALVEAYSESRQGVTNFDGVGITDENGCYTISGLRSTDQKGSLINDYVVTVHAPGYPNFSKGAKKADDTVDFIISRGKENEIAGTVIGYEGELFDNIDFIADIFNPDGVFITFVIVNKDGTFKFSGLDPEKQYLLKFTAFIGDEEILSQWIGESGEEGYNVGVENPDDPFTPPFSAKAFSTNTTLHFRFSISISDTEIIWSRRVRAGTGKRAGGNPMTEISSTSHTDKVSNNPNVSVTWAPFGENDIGYYYEFNQIPGHIITKRNAPGRPPIKTRQVTSGDMNGDNVSFYFHVAPVDDRGRIGYTATREFRIDTVPPSNGNVIAPETTSDRIISISLGVMDAKEMYISNTGYGQNGEWQTRVKTVQWELAQGEGIKKIYVQFRDEAQNVSNFMVTTEKTDIVENSSPVIEDQEFHVVENSGYGTIIGTIAANDDDEDSLTYTVTAGNTGEVFDVSESTGEIRVLDSSQLDYETISFYTLTVEVSDGLDTDTALITVNISDQDENPPVAEPQVFSVNENSSDETFVGKTEASDDSGGPLEFSITAGNIGDAFAIEKETGRITVRDGTRLDYETTDVYVLTVTVSDGINTAEAVITINIIDVNEQTLTVEDQTVALDENSAKETSVVTVSASGPIETLTYIITAGNTGNAFAIDADSGLITVNDSSQLDYEITQTYTLTVKVSDGTSDAEALITITINNLSEYKPVAENATFSVNENSPAGIFVGKVKASDADLMDTLEFSITAGNAGAFAIDSRNGNISVRNGALLDYEAVTVHTLTVAVSDGINTVSAVITINIIDVNEQVLTIEAQAFSVDENSANETSVGAVVASGPIQPLAYTITEGNT
ncbi:MAG: PKD domain-containing protein, partial [Desulfobacterales bacterium]|nr:PKD domain-containing protein [Desulfobacterales bacterium]